MLACSVLLTLRFEAGEPYQVSLDSFCLIICIHNLQYVGAADKTLPFDQCPPCVLRALELISARAAIMMGERPTFNELLSAAYMEKQSMGFHTDGERGLGPVVASLSMGSPAIMKFRTLEDRKTIVLSLVLRHVRSSFLTVLDNG